MSTSTDGATSTASSPGRGQTECIACATPVLVDLDQWASLKEPAAVCTACADVPHSVLVAYYRTARRFSGVKVAFDELDQGLRELEQQIDGLAKNLGLRVDGIVASQKDLEEKVFETKE